MTMCRTQNFGLDLGHRNAQKTLHFLLYNALYDFHVFFTLGVEVRLYARENGPGDSLRIVALSPLGKNVTKNRHENEDKRRTQQKE